LRLLRLALLLLSDADLEVELFCFLERLVIVARDGVGKKLIDIGAFGQNHHDREGFVAGRTERPEPLDIGNRHNSFRLSQPYAWGRERRRDSVEQSGALLGCRHGGLLTD